MPAWIEKEQDLMKVALAEAAKGEGWTHPNPMVGAVIARGQRVIGVGHHRRWGLPHAEVEALEDAGAPVRGADLYVTLEPCCHWGKTAPCTDAIIESGIRRVFVAVRDPNPMMRGKGIRRLRKAGIEVAVGLGAAEARKLNESYFKFISDGVPFVTLKLAQSLDGKIATRRGESRWISGPASRRKSRRLRAGAQAILVGAGTVVNDDPGLLPSPRRKNYLRCVLDSGLRISPEAGVVRTASSYPTLVYHCRGSERRVRRLEARGVTVVKVRAGRGGRGDGRRGDAARDEGRGRGDGRDAGRDNSPARVDIRAVLADLARRGVMHLFVEGGGVVASSFLRLGLVDKLVLFVAPMVMGDLNGLGAFSEVNIGSIKQSHGFKIDEVARLDPDLMITLYPSGSNHKSGSTHKG
jgi:diaminohydroxyphosphoribosylaminopyrimidine deaminase/5-amino-6-(5-phosphoribosylamino)uracil reductase